MNSFLKENKKNHIWLSLQYLASVIISLITLKLNLLNFGTELFGYWILISSIWGFGIAIDFGFGKAIIKYVSEYREKDESKINSILSSSFFLFSLFGLGVFIIILFIAFTIYFGASGIIPLDNGANFLLICIILGISFYFRYISIFLRSVFEGYNNFVLSSQLSLLNNVLILLSVILALLLNQTMEVLAYYYLISAFITMIALYVAFRIQYPNISISIKHFEFNYAKKVVKFSIAIQGAAVFGSLIDPVIKYLLASVSISSISSYEIARRFVVAITGLFNNTFRPILPKASALTAGESYTNFVFGYCDKVSKLGITYAGIVFGIGSIILSFIIKKVFGLDEAILIFLILALPESVNKLGFPIYNFLLGIGKAYFLTIMQLINLFVISFCVYVGLEVSQSSIGLLGYWVSVIIGNIIMMWFTYRLTSISMWKYLKLSKAFKLVLLNIFLLISILGIYQYNVNEFTMLIVLSIVSVLVFYNDVKAIIINNLK